MTIADSLTHVTTIYNTRYMMPQMLTGDVYSRTTSVFGIAGTVDGGWFVANPLTATSIVSEKYGISAASITAPLPTSTTSTANLPRLSTLHAQDQNHMQDTDYGKQIIVTDVSNGGTFDWSMDFYTDVSTVSSASDFSQESELRYSALRMRKTYRFMTNFWYGYGYQRSARIQVYGRKLTPSEWVSRIAPYTFFALGIRNDGGPGGVAFDIFNGQYSASFSIGAGSWVLPLQHLAGVTSPPGYGGVGNTSGVAAVGERSGTWDMYMDVAGQIPQTFANSFVPYRYTPEQRTWVASILGAGGTLGNSVFDNSVFVNPGPTNAGLSPVEIDPYAQTSGMYRDYIGLPPASVGAIRTAPAMPNPLSTTEVFIRARFPENAPFTSVARRTRWLAAFTSAAASLAYAGNAHTIVYSPFTAGAFQQPATGGGATSALYSSLNADLPYWLFNRNIWYAGLALVGLTFSPESTRITSLGGVSPVWSTPTSLTPSTQLHPYPFPGMQLRGLYPRSIKSRFSNVSNPPTNRNPQCVPLDVVNVIVLSDLSATQIATSTYSVYNYPGIITPDRGGANDLIDIRELVRVSSIIVPAYRGFKTLIFYDIDPADVHERLEMPTGTYITSTTTIDGFFAHTANWSGGILEYWTREGNVYSYFPQLATGPYSITQGAGYSATSFANLGRRTEATLGNIREYQMTNVRDARNNLAITHIRTLIAQHDPSGNYVVYCGTISALDPPENFLARILAASD